MYSVLYLVVSGRSAVRSRRSGRAASRRPCGASLVSGPPALALESSGGSRRSHRCRRRGASHRRVLSPGLAGVLAGVGRCSAACSPGWSRRRRPASARAGTGVAACRCRRPTSLRSRPESRRSPSRTRRSKIPPRRQALRHTATTCCACAQSSALRDAPRSNVWPGETRGRPRSHVDDYPPAEPRTERSTARCQPRRRSPPRPGET